MSAIRLTAFAGQNLRTAPHLLQDTVAQSANNVHVQSGAIAPYNGVGDDTTLAQTGPIKSLYRFADQYWFAWNDRVSALPGPIAGDTEHRTYYTGDGAPKMTYAGIATQSGDGKYPSTSYLLGIPAPTSACSAALQGSASDPTDLPESRAYVYTFVSAKGEEGAPSPASNILNWMPGQTVKLTGMIGAPTGNYNITNKRIYRTDNDGTFRYCGEIALGTTFVDNIPDNALGEALPSETWSMPPDDLAGLIALPNGAFAGYSKNTLCFSVPYMPHAWPAEYQIALDYPIVGIGAFGQSVAVATQANPYVVTGTDPAAMTAEKIEAAYPCLSAASVVDLGYAVAYASSEGMIAISSSGVKNLTASLMTREQWQTRNPAGIKGFRWQDKYVGIVSGHSFVIGPEANDFTDIDIAADGGWTDPTTGDLWLTDGQKIHKFNEGAPLVAIWQSKEWLLHRALNFAVARVEGSGDVMLALYGDGEQRFSGSVTAGKFFHLPGGYRATRWRVTLYGTGTITAFSMAESATELRAMQ